MLADDNTAIYVDPTDEQQVVADLAEAMNRLSEDGAYADGIAARARSLAEEKFAWSAVMSSWRQAYKGAVGRGR